MTQHAREARGGAVATIRPALEGDIPAIESVILAHDDPPAGAPPVVSERQQQYLRHLLERGTVLVAEVDGTVVAVGATVDTGRAVHLADLFVLPDYLGHGLGGRLIEPLFGDRWPRTTFASDDPRAMHLYVRMGMRPYWPNFYVIGDARRLPAGEGLRVDAASAGEVAEIEEQWTGADRSPDHALWAGRAGDRPVIVRDSRDEGPVAVGHSRPRLRGTGRWLERLTVAPGVDPVEPVLAALRDGSDGDGAIGACVLGPNPVLPVLLEAGFRIADRDITMASDPGLFDPNSLYDSGIP